MSDELKQQAMEAKAAEAEQAGKAGKEKARQEAQAALDAELKAQEGKWFPSYDAAKQLAAAAKEAGDKAAAEAAAGKEKAAAAAAKAKAEAEERAKAASEAVRVGGKLRQPTKTKDVKPEYPAAARPPATPPAPPPAASYADPVHQQSPAMGASRVSPLRLADPAHPARIQLAVAARIIDPYVRVELAGERTAMNFSAPAGEMPRALSSLDEAMRIVPEDMDLHVAKAGILHASAQFKSAEDELDYVLGKMPDHFEAKMWKTHWESWSDALRFPGWDEQQSMLHPVMAAHLRLNHLVQVVRDGLQKTLAIVANVQGPPFDNRTQVKVEWILSKTPYGPLVAYYLQLIEPMGEPSTMEAFVPIFQPSLYSPMEGYFLMQQLAFTPYCFVVLASGNTVTLNRRLVFGPRSAQKIRDIAGQAASTQSYLSQPDFKNAMQWHMNNFDMDRLTFE